MIIWKWRKGNSDPERTVHGGGTHPSGTAACFFPSACALQYRSVSGEKVLKGIENVFEMKREKQRTEIEPKTGKVQGIGKSVRNTVKEIIEQDIPALREQLH